MLVKGEYLGRQKEISIPYPEYWRSTFSCFFPQRCTICHDGFNELADISCGDSWLTKIIKKDNKGTSLIITRTKRGEYFLANAIEKKIIKVLPMDYSEVIKSQQGIIEIKNTTLRARINLCKVIKKTIPIFDLSRTPPSNLVSYLLGIEFYISSAMASRKSMWKMLDKYLLLRSVITNCLKNRNSKKHKI